MMRHKFIAIALTAVLISTAFAFSAGDDGWIQLFNGRNFDGWKIKIKGYDLGDNYNDTFRVEDGLLKVCYDQYEEFKGEFGHIFYERPFSNYVIRCEYRFVGDQCPGGAGWAFRNNGIMIHGQSPESMRKDQNFPCSIEVQLLGGKETGERSTVNLCTPGTNVEMDGKLYTPHGAKSTSETFRGDQWVICEIEVRGNEVIRHKIGGKTVLEYTKPQLDERDDDAKKLIAEQGGDKMLYGGTISLQSESHPTHFRKIELKLLK